MKLILIAAILCCHSASFGQVNTETEVPKGSIKYLDYKYGFKDIRLEDSIGQLKARIPVIITDSMPGKYFYKILDKKYLTIGSYQLDEVDLVVFQGRVCDIYIFTKGITNTEGMLSTLQDLFGGGTKVRYKEEYGWIGKAAICLFDENTITNSGSVQILSTLMDQMYDSWEKQNTKKGSNDF